MSNIVAGIGRGQMLVLDQWVSKRRAVNHFYREIFASIKGIEVLTEPDDNFYSNHWLTAINVKSEVTGITREEIRHTLLEDNIESRPLWKPMHLQPVFKHYPYYGNHLSERLFENGLCLPSGSNLTESDLLRIKSNLERIFSNR